MRDATNTAQATGRTLHRHDSGFAGLLGAFERLHAIEWEAPWKRDEGRAPRNLPGQA